MEVSKVFMYSYTICMHESPRYLKFMVLSDQEFCGSESTNLKTSQAIKTAVILVKISEFWYEIFIFVMVNYFSISLPVGVQRKYNGKGESRRN